MAGAAARRRQSQAFGSGHGAAHGGLTGLLQRPASAGYCLPHCVCVASERTLADHTHAWQVRDLGLLWGQGRRRAEQARAVASPHHVVSGGHMFAAI